MEKRIERRCVICGQTFYAKNYNSKYCSADCKALARKSQETAHNERRKAKRHMENALDHKENVLDKRLEKARELGVSYADYQQYKTLQKIAKGEL